jgi:hypothetical protein
MSAIAFFAYPDGHPLVRDAVVAAESLARGSLTVRPWVNLGIIGFKIDSLIREEIRSADVLFADITYPNANVFYEIGFAMGVGKPVVPTLNRAVEHAPRNVQRTGIFDTTGWAVYSNGDELYENINKWQNFSWIDTYSRPRNYTQPLYILDTLIKTDFRNQIFRAVENSDVAYRVFDPSQVPRLTASSALAEVSASAGIILPILAEEIVDAHISNLRASFLLGIAHALEIETLAIQYGNAPVPLDYRDFVTNSTFDHETRRHVSEFASKVLIWNQKQSASRRGRATSILSEIDVGSSFAENETKNLDEYFVKTAEYTRALRAEGAVVIGRKGSGKSAILIQLVNELSRDRRRLIVDLRPAFHNLSEMRETILSVVSAGIFDHTIAAFWQYIMYVEVLLKIRERVLPRSRNDFDLQRNIAEIEERFGLSESVVSGDFTSRLQTAVRSVIQEIGKATSSGDLRNRLTNIMFEEPIPQLRDAISSLRGFCSEIVLLVDDLDKGWPPTMVEGYDVTMVRHLIEVLNRMQRDLKRRNVEFRHLVFLRSDVYDMLVENTSDRGKYNIIKVDWSDPQQLTYLLRQRVVHRVGLLEHEVAWNAINPPVGTHSTAVDRMIEHSLRRPRFLIELCERTLSVAVNRGHGIVTEDDLNEGLKQMALYLVSDFGYELRDVSGAPEDIFYRFVGKGDLLADEELREILSTDDLVMQPDAAIELLLWYGFLGIVGDAEQPIFIYDREYDFRRLLAERSEINDEVLYAVNNAFLAGLVKG